MGKGVKRKNAGVGVDFRRVKHKVGKKLPRAQNQTDTSFKSRAISLPEQSVLQDKSGAAVTSRNLTLKDLLGQCGHYSEKVRREAVAGLAELVAAHPQELARHSTLVMETLAERITDGEKSVRAALREALASPILPTMGGPALGPFVPLLMAHICSAMTHLAEPIRADALGFLDLLTDWRPDLIAAAFLAPALQHFGDLLSKGARGRSLSAGSLAALHRTAAALERFLQRLAAAGVAGPAGGAAGVAEPSPAGLPLFRGRCGWPPLAGPGAGLLAVDAASSSDGGLGPGGAQVGQGQAGGKSASGGGAGEAAARQLLSHLLDCWSDCGPAQLATAPELMLAHCLLCTLRSCDHLLQHWGPALAGNPADKSSLAHSLLKRVAPVFPVQRPSVPPPAPVADALVQLNVAAAQLLARFLPSQLTPVAALVPGSGETGWAGRLLEWFEGVMRHESGALPAAGGDGGLFGTAAEGSGEGGSESDGEEGPPPAAGAKGRGGGKKGGGAQQKQRGQQPRPRQQQSLPAEVYQATLEGVHGVLPLVGGPRRRALLGAAWALWERSGVRSATRAQVLLFWRRLVADAAGSFLTPLPPSGEPLVLPSEALQWLQAQPRFLWELGTSSTPTTESSLRLLLDGARFACCEPAGAGAAPLAALQQQLAPLFASLLPAKAPARGNGKTKRPAAAAAAEGEADAAQRVLLGPLAKQPQRVQNLAVDLLLHLPTLQPSTVKTATLLCLFDAYPVATGLRLLDVVSYKAAAAAAAAAQAYGASGEGGIAGTMETDGSGQFGGMLLCLLSGCSHAGVGRGQGPVQQAQRDASWRRHEAVVGGACRSLLGCGNAGPMAQALAGPLLGLCQTSGSVRPLYGTLALGVALAAAAEPGDAAEGGFELVPPVLAAELPGAMLCYAVLCCASQQQHAQQGLDGGQQAQQEGQADSEEWLPAPAEALALGLCLLRALPSLLAPTLDCLAATLCQQAQQGTGEVTMAASAGSAVVDSRLLQQVRPVGSASWVAAAVGLLEGLLGPAGGDALQQWLVEENEARAEAALLASEGAVRRLEGQGHPAAPALKQAAGRTRAVLANMFGRNL